MRHYLAPLFEPEAVAEETSEPRAPRELFVGHRPLG